ncbi:MAG: hypothetical protein NTZ11_10645 [Gammaproteobacteria bacterium]|nr:hypothetical protein [Gammaproteobacteria bacterium]
MLAFVADGERRVARVLDWSGGQGAKPAAGHYIGPLGPTQNLAEAVDMRGTAGATSTVPGPAGRGIASIARTAGTGAAGTTDTYTITFTDSTTSTFQVINGAKGADSFVPGPASTVPGPAGRGIASIDRTAGTGAAGTTDTYTITFTDSTTSTFQVVNGANGAASTVPGPASTVPGPAGRGVASIARTAGTGAAGTTDTYTITFTDSTTSTFQVVNGANGAASTVPGPAGRGVASIARTAGTGAAGTTDTYTITFTDSTTSTFQVVNGANGAASTVPGPAGRGVASIARTAGTGAAGTTDTYTITFTDSTTSTFQVVNGANGLTGASAWTPILAVVTDGARRVLQVADWSGGSGTKPTTGAYVGPTGLTTTLANAVDLRALANTDGLPEGATNQYFTNARALAAIEASNAALGIFTMAERPAAAPANRGRVILVTGIGNVEFVQMISTGSKWVPFGGRALLWDWTTPSANVTTPGTATAEVSVADRVMTVPAGLATLSSVFEVCALARWPTAAADNTFRIKSGSNNLFVSASSQLTVFPTIKVWNKGTLTVQRRGGAGSGGTGSGQSTSTTYDTDIAIDTGAAWTITPTLAGVASATAFIEMAQLFWIDA